ncbi:MAG: energy transducer TonB [Nitrospinae bacterium]|nr:energy transducer TonB [Nitrospinota bacterium]
MTNRFRRPLPRSRRGGAPEPVWHPVEGVNTLPGFLRRAQPTYPEESRRGGVEARVVAEVFLEATGAVAKVDILVSGGERFDRAVIEAIRQSRFSPARIDGEPVRVRVRIPFSFRLR